MFESSVTIDPAEQHAALAAAIDAIPARAARGGTAAQCDAETRSLLALRNRLDARLLARVAAVEDQGFAASLGFKSTGSYLAAHGHFDAGHSRRLVVAARTADRLPQLGAMLAAGDISAEHVAAVGFSTSRVPSEVLAEADPIFASLASSAKPSDLRVAGKKLAEMYDADAARSDAKHLRDSRYLTLAQTLDGVWHLEGKLAPEDGVAVSLVLDSLSTKAGAEDDRTGTQRRADALVEMAALALRAGELPDTGGDQPRVTLLVQPEDNPFAHLAEDTDESLDDEELPEAATGRQGGLSLARHCGGVFKHRVGRGRQLSVTGFGLADAQILGATCMIATETLQRLCCDAEISIATTDATGAPLNMGRSIRDPNLAQKRATKIRDRHCVFPGCDTPPNRCQVHHIHFWGKGGCTDLCNLALLCHFHHHLVHEEHWTLAAAPPTPEHPAGGWIARAPNGLEHRQWRERAA